MTDETHDSRTPLKELVGSLAARLAPEQATIPRAFLRRAAPGDPPPMAFWQVFAEHIVPAGWGRVAAAEDRRAAREIRWSVALGGLADLAGMHNPSLSLGGALARAELSEARVGRLFATSGPHLWRHARALVHHVGERGVSFDHSEFVALILSDEPTLNAWHDAVVRRAARGYYAAL